MTSSQRIALNVAATYGRSLYALVCGLFSGRWMLQAMGETDYGLYGVIGGRVVALFNFLYLGRSVQAALSMGEKGPLYMRRTYNIRVLIHAAWVVLCFKLPMINAIAGVLALFFPRITIFGMQMAGMYKPSK